MDTPLQNLRANTKPIIMNKENEPLDDKQRLNQHLVGLLSKVANERCAQSFSEIFDHFSNRIYHFCFKQTNNEQNAKDLMQETMTTVWLKAHMFDCDKGQLSTWIYTIARNLSFDLGRKQMRRPALLSSDDVFTDYFEYQDDNDSGNDFDEMDQDKVWHYLEQLPPKQAEVIRMIYLEELSQASVAERLAVPLGTIKSRIRLGLIKLNDLIEKESFGYDY